MLTNRVAVRWLSRALVLALALPVMATAEDNLASVSSYRCREVRGTFTEYVADPFVSPSDPFGRVVNLTDGDLKSIGTAIVTGISPGPDPGTLAATERHVFVVNARDQITADGQAILTPIPGSADVHDVLTLSITGGLGKYAGAQGQIVATGKGRSFFPLPPGPTAGASSFVFRYEGNICRPRI